ncbi:hypothetical protein BRC81_04820 [Halobacteriales archaeon QS_1_68_20]|nr:MAG: hypothetical protein BRC81_04820 [Halobacteriales archaeon QS_1_68_20]
MGADIRVLCVDDDPSVVDLLAKVLDGEPDMESLAETDPGQAMETFAAEQVDCVVSDYQMPGMDGLELLEAVRERDPEVPFVLFTARGNEAVASEAVSAGVTDYVRKSTGMEEFDLLVNRVRNAVERRRARVNYREVFDAVDDALLVIDPETGRLVEVNSAACEVWGYDQAELVGRDPATLGADPDGLDPEFLSDHDADDLGARLQDAADGRGDRVDWRCRRADGEAFWASVSVRQADIEGQTRLLAVVRDVTERRERERRLAALLDGAEKLAGAETRQAVVDTAVDVATEEFEADSIAVETGVDPADYAESPPALTTGGEASDATPGSAAGQAVTHSLGIETESADGYDRDLLQLLEETAAVAYARASKAELLRERERTLERQRSELARLDRLNEVIRDINRTLVRATTRDEIERLVCEQLVSADPHQFAWIGSHDHGAGEVVPRACAGIDAGYLDQVEFPVEGDLLGGAVETAVVDHEVGVVPEVTPAAVSPEEHDRAVERGFRSVAVIPVVYGSVLYDVLAVYADEPGVFDGRTVAVLAELGETIGYAMHNVDRRRSQVGDAVVDLTFAVDGEESVLVSISDRLDERVTLEGTRVETDGTIHLFLSTGGPTDPSALTDAHECVVEASAITADGDLYEVVLAESTLRTLLTEYRASIKDASATDGEAEVVLEVPGGANVRALAEQFATEYGAELRARRERTPDPRPRVDPAGELTDALTSRQFEVLLSAYRAGFFEWPREHDGGEVAEGLGISQPTFHEHLRAAHRTLLSALLDDE